MPTLHLADCKEAVVPFNMEHRTFKSLANISSNTELVEQLLLLTKRNYEDTHKANPVAAIELGEWKRLILAEDVVTEGSFVCLDSEDRKSTRLNSSHVSISYAVFCLKKKKQ